jgi:hypothetical protein
VSKNDELNSTDLKNLALANSLKEHLDERDPVMYLIKQANALVVDMKKIIPQGKYKKMFEDYDRKDHSIWNATKGDIVEVRKP